MSKNYENHNLWQWIHGFLRNCSFHYVRDMGLLCQALFHFQSHVNLRKPRYKGFHISLRNKIAPILLIQRKCLKIQACSSISEAFSQLSLSI